MMDKMKVSFTIKVEDEFEVTPEEVQAVHDIQARGESTLKIDKLREEVANLFDIDISCVEVLEHTEVIIEGKGE